MGPEGLDDTYIAVVEPGEAVDDVAAEIGYPVEDESEITCDWIISHPGGWFEAVWSFGDLTHVVIAQDDERADAALLALFRADAVEAPAAEAARKAG